MKRNFKIIAMLAMLAAVLTAPVFAQTSPTNTATMQVFTTQVEDSMNVHDYTNLINGDAAAGIKPLENAAVFVGYNSATYPASLGYAFKPSEALYLGLWYTGNVMSFAGKSQQEQVVSTYNIVDQLKTQTVTTTTYAGQTVTVNNGIRALIGLGFGGENSKPMGIKVGFSENLQTREKPDFASTITEDILGTTVTYNNELKSYSYINGTMTPSIEWGVNLGNIRPYVGVNFNIYMNNETRETRAQYTEQYGQLIGGITQIEMTTGNNNDYINPVIRAGVELDLTKPEDPARKTIGLDLSFNLTNYDKSYDIYGHSGNVKGTYSITTANTSNRVTDTLQTKTTANSLALNITNDDRMGFSATPRYEYENKIDEKLKIGVEVRLPVTFTSRSYSGQYTNTFTTTKVEYKHDNDKHLNTTTKTEAIGPANNTDVTTLSIIPRISVGAIIDVVPDRFRVNAGFRLNPFGWTNTTTNYSSKTNRTITTTTVLDSNGNQISKDISSTGTTDTVTDYSTVADTWTAFGVVAAAGFTFNYNEKMAIDMACAISDTFSLSPLADLTVLFTFKF